ncbi:MAG: hypothetical protein DHS20C12_26180 [Pseudohongiella sp.]|nr:MAG: hypothetical protein DHS20C12_26180 [Pseudohongiella sp.]
MSRTKFVALVLVVLISTPIGLVTLRPDLVLTTLARPALSELGYELSSIDVLHLGISSTALNEMVLSSADQHLVLHRLHAQYSLSQLLAGTLRSISIDRVELQTRASPAATNDEPPSSIASLLDAFDALPVNEIYLPNIQLLDAEIGYRIGLGVQSPPLRISGEADLEFAAGAIVEFDIQRSGPRQLKIEANASMEAAQFLQSEADIDVGDTVVTVQASASVQVEPIRSTLESFLPAATTIQSNSLTLRSNFELTELSSDLALDQLSLVLESPNSLLEISQDSDLGTSSMALQLPVSLRGDIATATGEVQLSLSELLGTGSWTLEGAAAQSEHRFSNTLLSCSSTTNCEMHSDWESNLSRWEFGEYAGENSSIAAALNFDYSNDEMRLATDLVQIQVPSVISSAESVISELATQLQLTEAEFRVGEVISGGFNFSSSEFRLENSLAELNNPAYSGKLQLEDDVLTGILEFDLDQSLRLGIGLQHFFLRDTGDVVLQLGSYEFTQARPLSALITPRELDADIVAGQIEGLANISWSRQQDESWRFGGPIALKVDQVSGYFEDYLFVDLKTDLFAEASTPLGIQITNPASASLGRVDVGLPLENLSWQYRFDSLTSEVAIIDFNTSLLGGELSIPAARYNPARERQQVDVVLADIRVDSLVGLAEYPGLQADGLISGYLPFIIEGDSITIERGLVGALKPGGSIRYTPASPAPSSNQSIQLVNDALSNYQYQTMNTEVFFDETGELLLGVQLHGNNPDMNNGQAINLNVNITDNIPSLLKSLQASRVISDELQRFVSRP